MDVFDNEQTDYEKTSYGKVGYKRICRLRKKGKRRGIEVPPLGFELTKPDKPRVVFWVAAIVGIILFAGILVAAGFLIKYLIDVFSELYKDTGGLFKTLVDPKSIFVSQGLSLVPVLLLISAYLFVIMIGVIPLTIAIYCYRFARDMIYMARCSKEEFAKGEMISGHIITYIGVLVAFTVGLIVVLFTDAPTAKLLVGLIYGGVVIIFGGLLVLTIIEKKKCGEWFESLDEDKKQNYLAHDRALRRVKSRLNTEKQLWAGPF